MNTTIRIVQAHFLSFCSYVSLLMNRRDGLALLYETRLVVLIKARRRLVVSWTVDDLGIRMDTEESQFLTLKDFRRSPVQGVCQGWVWRSSICLLVMLFRKMLT